MRMRVFLAVFVLFAGLVYLAGCGGGSSSTPVTNPTGDSLTKPIEYVNFTSSDNFYYETIKYDASSGQELTRYGTTDQFGTTTLNNVSTITSSTVEDDDIAYVQISNDALYNVRDYDGGCKYYEIGTMTLLPSTFTTWQETVSFTYETTAQTSQYCTDTSGFSIDISGSVTKVEGNLTTPYAQYSNCLVSQIDWEQGTESGTWKFWICSDPGVIVKEQEIDGDGNTTELVYLYCSGSSCSTSSLDMWPPNTYYLYGATSSATCDYQVLYSPGSSPSIYTLIGTANDTNTFTISQQYSYYVVGTPSGALAYIDAIQDSTSSYWNSSSCTGNVQNLTNAGGAPDQQYATAGYLEEKMYTGSYMLYSSPGSISSITVYVDESSN